jgi:hypothetical protein
VSRCWACGGPLERKHHPTGRGPDGRYLDPRFRAALCHDDHELIHDGWRAQGFEVVEAPLTAVASVELRARRTAATYARLSNEHFDADPTEIAETFLVWANDLARHQRHLDEVIPRWRDDPGFH